MGFLPVEDASMFDRTVASPIANRCQSVILNPLGHRPMGEHDRLRRRQPAQAAGGHRAISMADTLADCHQMAVSGQAHVYALNGMPELCEAGIDVEIDTDWTRGSKLFVGKHAGNVDQDIGLARQLTQARITFSDRLTRTRK